MSNEDYFIKVPHSVVRIPAFGKPLRQYPTVFPVWSTLVSWGFYQDRPYFGNKNHAQSVFWADIVKDGMLPSTLSVENLSKVTGFDRRTIVKTLGILKKVCLISSKPNIDGEELFCVGYADKDKKGKIKFPTFLDSMGRRSRSYAGNLVTHLIFETALKDSDHSREIYNITYGANEILRNGIDKTLDAQLIKSSRQRVRNLREFIDSDEWRATKAELPHQFSLYFIDEIDKYETNIDEIFEFRKDCLVNFRIEIREHESGIRKFILADPQTWK